jgi:hypothetical protein
MSRFSWPSHGQEAGGTPPNYPDSPNVAKSQEVLAMFVPKIGSHRYPDRRRSGGDVDARKSAEGGEREQVPEMESCGGEG